MQVHDKHDLDCSTVSDMVHIVPVSTPLVDLMYRVIASFVEQKGMIEREGLNANLPRRQHWQNEKYSRDRVWL